MGAREIADKYIGRRGGKPTPERSAPKRSRGPTVKLSADEYRMLLASAELDDMIARCDGCGAWINRDEPAYCSADDDVTGCWSYVTGKGPCVSHRAPPKDQR